MAMLPPKNRLNPTAVVLTRLQIKISHKCSPGWRSKLVIDTEKEADGKIKTIYKHKTAVVDRLL